MPDPKKFLDSSGLVYYDQKIKDYIDNIVENDIGPAINAKANDAVFGASGTNHSKGLVPDPGSTTGSAKFLREDGSWNVPTIDPSVMPTVSGTVLIDSAASMQSDWDQMDSMEGDYIKNKPFIPTAASSIASDQTGYVSGAQVYNYAEDKTNKTTNINSGSTNTEYPTALAVKSYVDSHGFDPSNMTEVNITPTLNQAQADWSQSDTTAADYIKNKPTVPIVAQAIASGDNGYVTGDMVYDVLGDLETFLSNY